MDKIHLLNTLLVTVLGSGGIVTTYMIRKSNKKTSIDKAISELTSNVAKLADSIKELDSHLDQVRSELSGVVSYTIKSNRALCRGLSVVINALETNHINGDGAEARAILNRAENDLMAFEEKVIAKIK